MAKRVALAARTSREAGPTQKALEAVLATTEPNRLRIIFLLGEHGPMCVNDIAQRFKISRPAISHHLKILKMYGVVDTTREGREIYYSVCIGNCVETLRSLADALEDCCGACGGGR
jgi:DNA-binding transcriptional ArsR family regulator